MSSTLAESDVLSAPKTGWIQNRRSSTTTIRNLWSNRLWPVTADGRDRADRVADGVVDAIKSLAGRVKPLTALPPVGTGEGGLQLKRGQLARRWKHPGWLRRTTPRLGALSSSLAFLSNSSCQQ